MNKIELLKGRDYNLKTVQKVSRMLKASVLTADRELMGHHGSYRRTPNTTWQYSGGIPEEVEPLSSPAEQV